MEALKNKPSGSIQIQNELEQTVLSIIKSEFLQNKESSDLNAEIGKPNVKWMKWVSLVKIASRLNRTVYETISLLTAMKNKRMIESKLYVNKQFYACQIEGFIQSPQKNYYEVKST